MKKRKGNVPFAHVAIDYNHSQQPVPKGFPVFKRCEWLVVNCNVGKRAPLKRKYREEIKRVLRKLRDGKVMRLDGIPGQVRGGERLEMSEVLLQWDMERGRMARELEERDGSAYS